MTQPMREEATVATIRSFLIFSRQAVYPGFTGANLQDSSGVITRRLGLLLLVQLETGIVGSEHRGIQSATEQVPPESERMEAFTARM